MIVDGSVKKIGPSRTGRAGCKIVEVPKHPKLGTARHSAICMSAWSVDLSVFAASDDNYWIKYFDTYTR